MELLNIIFGILFLISILFILYLIFQQNKYSQKLESLANQNAQFLESIEKYIEIFNEQNIRELIEKKDVGSETLADENIQSIRNEYRKKLTFQNNTLTEEHEMLIDFVTLALSLLIKTPPNLRGKLIKENTDNEMIKKILYSKLPLIEKHYTPVSLLEIAISKENN